MKFKKNKLLWIIVEWKKLQSIKFFKKFLILRTDSHFVRKSKQSNPRTSNDSDLHTIFITHTSIDNFDICKKFYNFSLKTYKAFHYHHKDL